MELKDVIQNVIALYAAVVATIVAIVQYKSYKGKLIVYVTPSSMVGAGVPLTYTFTVTITNSGTKAIGVKSLRIEYIHHRSSGLLAGLRGCHIYSSVEFPGFDLGPLMVGEHDMKEFVLNCGPDDVEKFKSNSGKLVVWYGNPLRSKVESLRFID